MPPGPRRARVDDPLVPHPPLDWLRRHYFTIDSRTLALTRVALALVLLLDLGKRSSGLIAFYTEAGLLPIDAARRLHPAGLSVLWYLETPAEVAGAFLVCGVVYVALLVGFLTRLAQILALVAIVSLQTRVQLLTIGGDIVVCLLSWWMLFLPLGRSFSVDAWLQRRKPAEANPSTAAVPGPVTSIAVFGAILQLAVIYFFNAVHKDGDSWREGTAIHYTLWLDRVVTPLAVWYRGLLAPAGSRLLTYATLATEWSLPVLILSPWGAPWARRAALGFIVGLHGGIALVLNIGIFSGAMIAFSTVLVSTRDWEDLVRLSGRLRRGRVPVPAVASLCSAPDRLHGGREGLAGAFFVLFTVATLQDNWAVPHALRPPRPSWLHAVIGAMRVHQGWHMFAPDVGAGEMTIVVDALTADGRRIDPIAEASARIDVARSREVPEQVGQDVYWHTYALRVPEVPVLHQAFSSWLFSRHERTGRPGDRIVHFRAFVVTRPSPPPGSDTPGEPSDRLFLEGRE
jgi:hypothetical protein